MPTDKPPAVGAPDSRFEREAEHLAGPIESTPGAVPIDGAPADGPDRVAANDESLPAGPEATRDDEDPARAREDRLAAGLWPRIRALLGAGRPLPGDTADHYGERLGYEFSAVRLHTDAAAAEAASELGARAFTYGRHIFFAEGAYQPYREAGRRRLAHELTHVAQQGGAPALADHGPGVSPAPAQLQGDWVPQWASDAASGAVSLGSDAVGAVGDTVGAAVSMGAGAIWRIVRRVAPDAFVDLAETIRDKGFFGFIKDRIGAVTDAILAGLGDKSPFLSNLVTRFAGFATGMVEIVSGLARGDCEPLFAALRQLRDMVTSLAGEAWDGITDFFRPIGDFFSDVWDRFGAPLVDWMKQVAGETWDYIKGLGEQIWEWTRPVVDAIRSVVSDAWDWIADQLGLGGGDSEGGLVQWIQDQAQSAWNSLKTELQPVIRPIKAVVDKVKAILPLEAITDFRETVNGWLQQVSQTARAMDEEEGVDVADRQASLRDQILPAILERIQAFRATLVGTGRWVSGKIGDAVATGQQFLGKLSTAPIIGGMRGAFDWLDTALDTVNTWARDSVDTLFTRIGDALVHLSRFIEPVLNALRRIVGVLGNLLGRLPDFLLGPVWWVLPQCIKQPIKRFFIEQILSRIPLFQQLTAIGELWERLRSLALGVLRQVFVDGDLSGALWRFFRGMLGLVGIPAELVVHIVANAAEAFSDILMDPVGFLGNLLRAMKEGASRFFGNIFTHLFNGISGWLFGQIEQAGLTPPDITSFRSVLGFVFELLGLTLENIWNRLAEQVGRPVVDRIRGAIDVVQGAWAWIRVVVTEGLTGLWTMIRERIADLWNTVLGAVVSWVNSAIIQTASRWLLSLLDATGITPVINALIALYRAIESFAEYLREMLEIVASVTRGIADLAKGKLAVAVEFLVTSLANSIPIVVGFLANQFGLGRLGDRIGELVEGMRERINNALDWIIEQALRVGRGFIEMVRSGAELVRHWWQQRTRFRDAAGESHELYFPDAQGDLMLASTPRPVGAFLNQLQISADDPQKTRKEGHKADAERLYREITRLRQTLRTRERAGDDVSDQRNELASKFDTLATHLTPLLVGTSDTAGGRVPNPLTLGTLDDVPVATPRTAEEADVDLDAARQLVMLVQEQVDGSDEMAGYFERIRQRFALDEVGFVEQNERFEIRLRAGRERRVSVSEPVRGDTPGLNLSNEIRYRGGTAAGDSVGVDMEAENLGPSHARGSGPGRSALSGVMDSLVTDPGNRNPSKFVKGHLLNDNLGGPGSPDNLYPITAEANRAHESNVESPVKRWVNVQRYWVYYRVRVRNVTEHIALPGEKNADNWINATLNCHAYIKQTDGGRANEFTANIVSRYVRAPGAAHTNPNEPEAGTREARRDTGDLSAQTVPGGGRFEGEVLESGRTAERDYQLDPALKRALDAVASDQRDGNAIRRTAEDHNRDADRPVALGPARIDVMLAAYQRYHEGNLTGLSQSEKASLSYVNERSGRIRDILVGQD